MRKRSTGRHNSHYQDSTFAPKATAYFELTHEYEQDKQSQKQKRSNSSIEVVQKTQSELTAGLFVEEKLILLTKQAREQRQLVEELETKFLASETRIKQELGTKFDALDSKVNKIDDKVEHQYQELKDKYNELEKVVVNL